MIPTRCSDDDEKKNSLPVLAAFPLETTNHVYYKHLFWYATVIYNHTDKYTNYVRLGSSGCGTLSSTLSSLGCRTVSRSAMQKWGWRYSGTWCSKLSEARMSRNHNIIKIKSPFSSLRRRNMNLWTAFVNWSSDNLLRRASAYRITTNNIRNHRKYRSLFLSICFGTINGT